VQAQQVPVRVEEHDSAVEGATVPFDDTDDGMHAPGGLGDQIEVGPGYGDRPVVIAAEPVTALIGPLPHHRSERMTLRVPADECLREYDQTSALPPGVGSEVAEFGDGGSGVEGDRSRLHRGSHIRVLGCHHRRTLPMTADFLRESTRTRPGSRTTSSANRNLPFGRTGEDRARSG